MRRSAWGVALALILVCSGIALAQPAAHPHPDLAALEAQHAIDEQIAVLAERLVSSRESPGREFQPAFRQILIERLKRESVETLTERLTSGNIRTAAITDATKNLAYNTLAVPCRIIDTRLGGGALTPGTPRDFKVAGSAGFAAQGGNASGCGVPVGATAVFINFVAVNAQGKGNLQGTAYPNAIPSTGSIINYQALVPSVNLANGVLLGICNPAATTCTNDITLQANLAAVDIVGDVLGYAMTFPKSFTTHQSILATVQMGTTCTNYTSMQVNPPANGTVWVRANVKWFFAGTSAPTYYHAYLTTAGVGTCTGRPGLSNNFAFSSSAYALGGQIYDEIGLDETFTATAGVPLIIYLNAQADVAGQDIVQAGLTALFMPD